MSEENQLTNELDEKPPFSSWKRIYQVVIGNLLFLMLLFYFLTRVLS